MRSAAYSTGSRKGESRNDRGSKAGLDTSSLPVAGNGDRRYVRDAAIPAGSFSFGAGTLHAGVRSPDGDGARAAADLSGDLGCRRTFVDHFGNILWQWLSAGVVAVWLIGVSICSARLLGAWRFTARLRATSSPAPAEWQQTIARIAARMRTSCSARLLISSLVDVPMVFGWLRPVILIPVEALTGMPAEHLTALLAHEMAHVRRNDYLASILQNIAEALLFYHPAVWWISEQIRIERELCCDDLAVAASGDVLLYARALAALESRQTRRHSPVLAANGGSLVNRIRRLIEGETKSGSAPGAGAAWAMALLWFAGIGLATVHAAQTPQAPIRVVNPEPIPLFTRTRRTLLYDPFIPGPPVQRAQAQVERAQPRTFASPWSKWLNEDVLYIVTDPERTAFLQLSTDEEREQFVEQFWLRRDPTPNTAENEFKNEHYRRIAYANLHFSSRIPGWKTDRGRIYTSFGAPDEIGAHPSGQPFPTESWVYRFIEGLGANVILEFTDWDNSGEYRLSQSAADRLKNQAAPWPVAPTALAPKPVLVEPQLRTYTILPMTVRVDYVRATDSSTMANITVQFENHDLQLELKDGVERSSVNLFGRITTMARRPITTFEKPVATAVPPEMLQKFVTQRSIFQQSVPLSPGHYRMNVVAKDTLSGNIGNYEVALDVPQFSGDKLASSSLILADTIERLPARTIVAGSAFAIGDAKVRPRLGNRFTADEKLGIYLQLYNFRPDDTTQKPIGSVEYEIDNAGSNEKVMVL